MGDEAEGERRPCPFCSESILAQAVLCRYCGSRLDSPPAPVAPPGPRVPGWVDLIAAVGILWALDLAAGIALVAGGGLKENSLSPGPLLLTTLVSFALLSVVVWFFACRRHGRSIREGLALGRVGARVTALSVGGGVAVAVLGILLLSHFSTGNSMMAKLASHPGGLAALIVMALAAPPFEEMYYRGFLYPILERKANRVVAALVVILWFTGAHLMQLAEDPIGLVPIFAISVSTTLLRSTTGSLVPAVVAHWVYNGVLVLSSVAHFP